MFCPYCKRNINDNETFCPYCGKAQPKRNVASAPVKFEEPRKSERTELEPEITLPPKAKKGRISPNAVRAIITVIAVVVIIIVVCQFYYPWVLPWNW